MQNESHDFLRYFIQEEIYNVPEKDIINSVQVMDNQPEEVIESISRTIPFKGENQHNILVIVEDMNNEFLAKKDEEFLMQVLNAVELNADHVAIVNSRHGIGDILEQIDGKLVICFIENNPKSHEIDSIPNYQMATFGNGKNILKAHQLPTIIDNRDLKMKLWTQLKIIFNK